MTFDYTEFNKLCNGLIEKEYNIKVHSIYDGRQVIVYDEKDEVQWDAVIHYFSYGHEDGLLEVYGTIIDSFDKHKYCIIMGDTVLGNLSADQILEVC